MPLQLDYLPKTSCLTLSQGDESVAVQTVQKTLNKVQNSGLNGLGYFGPATDSEVKRFQKAKGLAVDGVVGAKTWAALGFKGQKLTDPEAFGGTSLPVILTPIFVNDPQGAGLLQSPKESGYVEWDTPADDGYLAPGDYVFVGTHI